MKAKRPKRQTLFNIQGAVCVVTGDEKTRSGLYMVLGTLGVTVATFSTAEEFLERLRGQEPALLITDLDLPRMSGLDLLEALAGLPEDQRTVFHLSEIEGLSYEEISTVLEVRPGTIASRKHHAVLKLRNTLRRCGHGA